MSEVVFKVPRTLRRGNIKQNERESVTQGVGLVRLIADTFELPDLGQSSVLDMGCGCKLVQAIMQEDLPIGRYVGVDVFADLIEFLEEEVSDPRFHFQYLNTHNQMYNPEGEPLSADTRLLLEEESFDIICLFSVFTHLAPHDYVSMLKMLRRYVKPDGHIIFSLFLNETTEGGHSFWDGVVKDWTDNQDKIFGQKGEFLEAVEDQEPPDFLDWDPSQPLKWAIYSRKHARELVEGTGWEIESLNDPVDIIQHYMVCKPA